jgi:hypothetical protein
LIQIYPLQKNKKFRNPVDINAAVFWNKNTRFNINPPAAAATADAVSPLLINLC